MKTEIKKRGKGHDIFINGEFVMWVIGSRKNAEKELKNYETPRNAHHRIKHIKTL